MFGYCRLKVSNIHLHFLLICFGDVSVSSFGASPIGCPVEFELFIGVGNDAVVVVDIKIAGAIVINKFKKPVFERKACEFVLDKFDGGELLVVAERTN